MKKICKRKESGKRAVSLFLSVMLCLMTVFPYLPLLQVQAAASIGQIVTLTSAHGDIGGPHKLYCIDKGGLAIYGIADDGDKYAYHRPSEAEVPLSKQEQEYIFWGILTLQASLGEKKAIDIVKAINTNAMTQGKEKIGKLVTEEDLKALIYMSSVRDKYPWLEEVAANTEEYLKMAGLIGGNGGSTQSGKKVPDIIAHSTSLTSAYQINCTDFTIHFDAGGADADFIQKVPILFSNDNGTTFNPMPTDGWTYSKTANSITFSNPNPQPPKALIKFVTQGTEYETQSGIYTSEEDLFKQCLQIWECVECSGTHTGGTPPSSVPWIHQRMVWLEFMTPRQDFYAALAGDPTTAPSGGEIAFQVFRHEEDFTSTYNVQLYKYDYETGQPLENARFALFERFDDKGEINTEKDGPVHIYEGGEPYASYHKDNPVIWTGFRKVSSVVTDSDGHAARTITHGYHYDKTFCDGHPAPVFVAVPEPEIEEEGEAVSLASDDDEGGDILNAEEIEAAKTVNRELAQAWLDCVSDCEEQASGDFEGVHFHWLMSDVDRGEIENIASSGGEEGSTPSGGNTSEPDADTAYEESGCYQDMQDTYEKFVSLKYSYAFSEFQARDGYIRHDLHPDDLPVEIITTDSSEAGANAFFAGEYSKKESLENGTSGYSSRSILMERSEEKKATEPVHKNAVKQLFQEAKATAQDIVMFLSPEVIVDENEIESVEEQKEKPAESETKAEQAERPAPAETEAEIKETAEEEEPEVEISSRPSELVRAAYGNIATPSSAGGKAEFLFIDENIDEDIEEDEETIRAASPSEAATPSEAAFRWLRGISSFRNPDIREMEGMGREIFQPAYEEALSAESSGEEADPGPDNNYSHCNNADREGNAWRVYDHRTEGEFHINKKDLDLSAGESDQYSPYGDTQGDGTLEGAVYGLFAAEDISHPDGKTGVVYRANNLVAIATTDKNGDASFLANTEAPGQIYDYQSGSVVDTGDGWRGKAPKNLYQSDRAYDDYSEDGHYQRQYRNNEADNGNCWIGRPLLMGDYYVKELSRSEGYELSIGNKANDVTNLGQDLEIKAPEQSEGYTVISQPLFADEQTSDDGAGAGPNELFFSARSKDTKDQKYDIVLSGLPKGATFYRREEGTKKIEVQVGTGTYEKIFLTNLDGSPKYIRAENDYQYPKYNADGSLMLKDVPMNYIAERFRQVTVRPLDESVIQAALNQADGEMSEEENVAMLSRTFTAGNLPFVKGKMESALRRNGKSTPRSPLSGGGYDYSSIYVGVFDSGVREGERDQYGVSGVTPGSPAAYTVYGSPVRKVAIAKQKPDGTDLTVGDAILSLLNYYDKNPFYSYSGIDAVEVSGDDFIFSVYASVSGNPENFMVLGSDPETDSIIYHLVPYIPADSSLPPRYIYAAYSNNADYNAFGTYEDYREGASGPSAVGSATLITDAIADPDGNLKSKTTEENVYYQTGELVRDSGGSLIQAFEYREITRTELQEVQDGRWQEIPVTRNADGTYVLPVNAAYTDVFGVVHTNDGQDQTIEFKAVLKEKEVTLSEEDVAVLGAGFIAGRPMDSASYYVHVRQAKAKAYLDYQNMNLVGGNTFVILTSLVYPGQEKLWQDAGTREQPAQIFERIIRQKIKIVKDIETTPDGTYAHNTNADSGHTDGFIDGIGGTAGAATKLDNFRFKVYLKSNLERLYRDEAGEIAWLDRDGEIVDIQDYKVAFPVLQPYGAVQKLYTKVPHKTNSLTTGSINNNVWDTAVTVNQALYSYQVNGMIEAAQNPGYTRLLETVVPTAEDGAGKTREVECYNYEKFFDAVQTANHDKWDLAEDNSTSFKPFSYIRELLFGTGGGEKEYPASHNNGALNNAVNTSQTAKDNAKVSDAVRQFAITWYLDDEVAKLTEDNGHGEEQADSGRETYQDEIYDLALQNALVKAENYLKPFFTYDLDTVYAIEWDGEADGGSDRDLTTLAASKDGYYYGVSKYLPYGVYVAVEQQPYSAELGDFYNKHYKTDQPKEIILPSVYEPGGNEGAPESFRSAYEYRSADTPEQLQQKFHIRFNDEWAASYTDDLRSYVIRAHNHDGDFEIYKYGLDAGRLSGTITYPGGSYDYQGFTVSQGAFDPYKDIYEAENGDSDYRINQVVGQYAHYGAISETAGISDNVLYQYGPATDDNNPSGFYFKDRVKTMTGALTAYDGRYAASLVPWTVTEPADAAAYDPDRFTGYADRKYRNIFYTAKLRIEKLDSETGENILHDGALFAIYSAEREDERDSEGKVKFYETDTVIAGSKEFLEAMGARDITPTARPSLPWQIPYKGKYYGTVSAGTPICRENEQILMQDENGEKTGTFRAYTTTNDIRMTGQDIAFADQNTGYLETPQPLGAGCYVLAEIKAPVGYTRTQPVAIEIYSDEVAYYLDGDRDERVVSTIYEYDVTRTVDNGDVIVNPDGTDPDGNTPQDKGDTARVYVNNTPIRLEVTKAKPDETMVSYELNGRVEGSLTRLKAEYGLENLELAYNDSGNYLGYGWRKGFLDALKQKQAAGESIDLLYEDGVFTGKAILHKTLETAGDTNRYLPGAMMTLYDAIEVKPSGDREDYQYDGVNIERDRYGNVTRMYVQKGYAGNKIRYVLDKTDPDSTGEEDDKNYTYDDQEDDKGAGTWTSKTVEREDTDILFYDLGGLEVIERDGGILYGYDASGRRIQVKNGMSCYALKNGTAFLEIVCDNYENLHYSAKDRVFDKVPAGTELYHLDADGLRDSRVNPYTGMAYVVEETTGKILVWPIEIAADAYGNVIAREKITTSRIASIQADTEGEYTIGTYDSQSEHFDKRQNPVLDEHGFPVYYQRSDEIYQKGRAVYDRDGDYVRYKYDDKLKAYNDNAYQVKMNQELRDIGADPETDADDAPLYHRQGESCLMENTWITGERSPNDPFRTELTAGQVDILKRVPTGTYIMEELAAPEGWVKAMPVGLTVGDSSKVQTAKATDRAISTWFDKVDRPETFRIHVLDRDQVLEEDRTVIEGKGSFTYESIKGAKLALYRAKRVHTEDTVNHPSGYYLEKTETRPASWTVLDADNKKVTYTANWTTGQTPKYLETVPKGYYILEETEAPSGYVRNSMEVEVRETGELQYYILPNDHTKIEFFKYIEEESGQKVPMPNRTPAELALYEAITDQEGIVMEDGIPKYDKEKLVAQWTTDDCREYTDIFDTSLYAGGGVFSRIAKRVGVSGDGQLSGFTFDYEKMFHQYGTNFDKFTWKVVRQAARSDESDEIFYTSNGERVVVTSGNLWFSDTMSEADREGFAESYRKDPEALTVSWLAERSAKLIHSECTDREESVKQLWRTETGRQVSICAAKGLTTEGKSGYVFDYRFNYEKLDSTSCPNAVSYDLAGGDHRIDYLPLHKAAQGFYVLVERKTPKGYAQAAPKPVIIEETSDIQLYSLKNEPKFLEIEKVDEDGTVVKGAKMALYRAGIDGELVMDEEHLTAAWTSGEGTAPFKPHRIAPVSYGSYYLVEQEAPAGYAKMEPRRIAVTQDSDPFVRAVNQIKQGVIRIEKSDAEEKERKLPGAVFEVRNLDTEETFYLRTDERGLAESAPVKIGTTGEAGYFLPYRFRIQEVTPPENYKLNLSVHQFQFTDEGDEILLSYRYELSDEPTEIVVSKADFNNGGIVKGARLAVYAAKLEDGVYESDGEALEEWISDGTPHVIKGKLSSGRTYLLRELSAPAGYTCADPLLFTISDDGRRIVSVTDNRNLVRFHTSDSFVDAVESVTVIGRRALECETILTDLETGKQVRIPAYQTEPLTEQDGLSEGHLYEQRSVTYYTDGKRQGGEKTTFRLHFKEDGTFQIEGKTPEKTVLTVEDPDGEAVERWEVENRNNSGYAHTIFNPEFEEGQSIKVIGNKGRHGASVRPGDILKYEITYKNNSERGSFAQDNPVNGSKNIRIAVKMDPQLAYMPANSSKGGKEQEGIVTWHIKDVGPGESGSVILTAAVKSDAEGILRTDAAVGEKHVQAVNCVAHSGTLTIVNQISGTAKEELQEEAFTYRIELWDKDGSPLLGKIHYIKYVKGRLTGESPITGKLGGLGSEKLGRKALKDEGLINGELKSGETISFKDGEAVVLSDIPWGTTYQVVQELKKGINALDSLTIDADGMIGSAPASAIFQNHKNDSSVREIFKKGEKYDLVERTIYSDGFEEISNRLTFTLNENASVAGVEIYNKPTHTVLSKTDIAGGPELPGARLRIEDETGTVIEEWTSTDKPHELLAVLEAGRSYTLIELAPPDGYAYAEPITFTVSEDGTVDKVRMEDRKTEALLSKTDITGGEELYGAHLQVQDLHGNVIADWISGGRPYRLKGKLNAGETYLLMELSPPDGYWTAEPIPFTVSKDGAIEQINLKDYPTKILIEKYGVSVSPSTGERTELGMIEGARMQIQDRSGAIVCEFYTKAGTPHEIIGLLTAGTTYRLVEIEAPPDYERAEPVEFTLPKELPDNMIMTVKMEDVKRTEKEPEPPSHHDKEEPPPKPQVPRSIGYITAHNRSHLTGQGEILLVGHRWPIIPGLGDFAEPMMQACACLVLLVLALLCIRIGRAKAGRKRRWRRMGRNVRDERYKRWQIQKMADTRDERYKR